MINKHYLDRYKSFIEAMKEVKERKGYTEVHHIQPRCLHGTDDKHNLIELSLREHFLAHWLLWKAYPDYLPICSAFLQMNNKNPNTTKGFQGRITSRVYESLKTQAYGMISERMTGRVFVKDEDGKVVEMSSSEYKVSDFKFHTAGKVWVFDIENNKWIYVSSSEYRENKEKYLTRLSSTFREFSCEYKPNPHEISYNFFDIKNPKRILRIKKSDASRINKKFGYKRLKQIIKQQIACIDEHGNNYKVSIEDYDASVHIHLGKNTVKVYDKDDGVYKSIPDTEYFANRSRYNTSTKGKVLVKDDTGKSKLVTKDEFANGYSGHTKGLTTVKNLLTGEFVQVSQDEFKKNRHKYTGPCQGKVNARNKHTGEMKQISKAEYNANKDIWAGASYGKFKIQNILTNEVKAVTIWDNLKKYDSSEWKSISKKYKLN
jgi:hypothetical protein